MREKEFSKDLGATAGCTARLVKSSKYCGNNNERMYAEEQKRKELIYGDSWFGSVICHVIMIYINVLSSD